MLIGEVAKRSGVTTKTLRFYEEAGLLVPPGRTSTGYRDYDDSALERLAFIRAAQAAGLTLAEIREVIAIRDSGRAPCSHVGDLLDAKAAAVTRQLTELRHLKGELDRLRRQAAEVDPSSCRPGSVCAVLFPDDRLEQPRSHR